MCFNCFLPTIPPSSILLLAVVQLDAHMSLLIALALSSPAVALSYSYSAPTQCDPFTVRYSGQSTVWTLHAPAHSPCPRRRAAIHSPALRGTCSPSPARRVATPAPSDARVQGFGNPTIVKLPDDAFNGNKGSYTIEQLSTLR